ncbi:MAG: hydrolase, partial [Bacilli bacterium]|nr:hydrolase [Bacilli bacterium]
MNKLNGLTVAEVENRILNGQINYDVSPKTQSIEYIILSNILTPFNLLNFFLAFLLIMVGSYKNLFF